MTTKWPFRAGALLAGAGLVSASVGVLALAVGGGATSVAPRARAFHPAGSASSCPSRPIAAWSSSDPLGRRQGELCLYPRPGGLEFEALAADPSGEVSLQILECAERTSGPDCFPNPFEPEPVIGREAVTSSVLVDPCFWAQATTDAGGPGETAETAPLAHGPGIRTCLVDGKLVRGSVPEADATKSASSRRRSVRARGHA